MKQVVIIGGSPAGAKAAEEIRSVNPECSVKIVLSENHPPFCRKEFPQFLANELAIDKLYFQPKSFYEQKQIELITDKKLSRVNFKRGQVFFEDKEKLEYDALVITDTPAARLPDVKGVHRAGNFAPRRITDAGEIFKLLPTTEAVAIQSRTLAGLRLALALRKRDKEVLLVSPEPWILSSALDGSSSRMLRLLLEEAGIRVLEQNEIVEVLGDAETKAVRLKNGKVIASQMVLWPDAQPDLRIFKETELQLGETIGVNANFQTNISNVFCVDDVCPCPPGLGSLDQDQGRHIFEQQGKVVAAMINGQGMIAEFFPSSASLKFARDSFRLLGDTSGRAGIRTAVESDLESKRYKKVFVVNDALMGAVLVNADSDCEKLLALIQEKTPISKLSDKIWQGLQEVPPAPAVPVAADLTPAPASGEGPVVE